LPFPEYRSECRSWCWLAFALLLCAGCVYLPRFDDAVVTKAEAPSPDSRIAGALGEGWDASRRALLIQDPHAALTSRLALIGAAEHSIDLQYFIWQNDPTGILVVSKLLGAADRGVRIRGLLDDVQLEGLVSRLNALNEHPNIEIRIFNPFSVRLRSPLGVFRFAEFVIDGNRLNHRMHNKLMVADNQLAILGGRNIGDDYFGESRERLFIDTDVLLSGPIVPELSTGFDAYWNSRWVYPVDALGHISLLPVDLDTVRQRIDRRLAERPDLQALRADDAFKALIGQLLQSPAASWSGMVIDDPDVSWFNRPDEIAVDLTEVALSAQREVLISTPYLVPTKNLLKIAETLIERGVKIKVLTNSLSTNDVVIAHSAYARYRREIIEAGVELYELRGDAQMAASQAARNISLHSKYIIFDDDVVFVGSLNLDPRSLYLNTELGAVLNSSALAEQLRGSFLTMIQPENAWRVLSTSEGLRWQSSAGTLEKEPAKGSWQRFRNWLYGFVPVGGQL
jgi:putative cardiolipin synthase